MDDASGVKKNVLKQQTSFNMKVLGKILNGNQTFTSGFRFFKKNIFFLFFEYYVISKHRWENIF